MEEVENAVTKSDGNLTVVAFTNQEVSDWEVARVEQE